MKKPKYLKAISSGLAGAAALAAGSEAYGGVVPAASLPANFTPSSGATAATGIAWDVDGDGTNDFNFLFRQTSTTGNFVIGIYGYGGVGINCSVAYQGPFVVYTNRLAGGDTIGPSSDFEQTNPYVDVLASKFSGSTYGQFTAPNSRGFVGFEFTAGDGQLHYGYIDLFAARYRNAANPGGLQFFSASYDNTPNTPITIVPEPGSLAALAFGGALLGAVALRRRKAAAQA